MNEVGFKHVFGIDPFVPASKEFENGTKNFRGDIEKFIQDNPYQVAWL